MEPDVLSGILGIIIGFAISCGNFHQLYKVIKLKDSKQISVPLYGTLVTAGVTWLVHGIYRDNIYLIITQSICVAVNAPAFIYYLVKYIQRKKKAVRTYNKLIRDKILEIIRAAGEEPHFRTLKKEEFIKEIKKKILEEVKELAEAKNKKEVIDEIVDIQELMDVLVLELGLTKSQIKKEQKIKNRKRGGFKKRLFLIKTKK